MKTSNNTYGHLQRLAPSTLIDTNQTLERILTEKENDDQH